MNIIIDAIISAGEGSIIQTNEEALACLLALKGHIQSTIHDLESIGLLSSVHESEATVEFA